ncbi:MAG: hypothetical protein DMD59_12970 [Gemmatimonadetes bacterium]|nr:MAG: hypothetical protein DMD59_12970 [Gemmatimonadota bacterium]
MLGLIAKWDSSFEIGVSLGDHRRRAYDSEDNAFIAIIEALCGECRHNSLPNCVLEIAILAA